MHAAISRPQALGAGTSASHRAPRKSASFLSLRREKEKSPPLADPYSVIHTPSGSHTRPTYFDAYPKEKQSSTRSSRSKPRSAPHSSSSSPLPEAHIPVDSHHSTDSSPAISSSERSYAFPSIDPVEGIYSQLETIQLTPKPYSRTRSRTGPSSKSNPHWMDPNPPALRLSGSSTQHSETPPDTPLDNIPFPDFSGLVSAPVSGVETMDALVDNMNGGDDILSSSLSSRARFGVPGHHPLYEPPLPTPPPGVVLGGGKARRTKKVSKPTQHRASFSGDDDDNSLHIPEPASHTRRRRPLRPSSARAGSSSTITPAPSPGITPLSSQPPTPDADRFSPPPTHSYHEFPARAVSPTRKTSAPSISDIIRAYAPPEATVRARPSLSRAPSMAHSHGHATVHEMSEPEPEPLSLGEETEVVSRSSIDSIADEIQQTLRNQPVIKATPPPPPSAYLKRHSTFSDNVSYYSPRSDSGAASIYASSVTSSQPPLSPFDTSNFMPSLTKGSPSQAVAQYLRSTRLTTLLKLTRSPHASQDNPLTVSLSDLGSPTGFPVVVFLGLGCVRHIMGLYDEMADCLGLRLITIDRWGLGRTEPRAKSTKGIIQWASVVEEVLDLLHIKHCSIMAHSAGAPYALSFANKVPERIIGDICLLAPWVNESGGYKWLKYVPNGILKTAQAAEWKLQAWMIGKPPTIPFEGIGYTAAKVMPPKYPASRASSPPSTSAGHAKLSAVYPSSRDGQPRPSMGSSNFSEYDDLRDFDGRFESGSTLGTAKYNTSRGIENPNLVAKRKNSRGFLNRLKGSPSSQHQSPSEEKPPSGKRLKALRSMSSLKSKSPKKSPELTSPQLPPSLKLDVGLGLDELNWTKSIASSETSSIAGTHSMRSTPEKYSTTGHTRANGRRSISFTGPRSALSLPGSPAPSSHNLSFATDSSAASKGSNSYQAALGNALLAASHAESARGAHNDLLQILNHENHSWGFSYTSYPHGVKVWYGDKDEKIAEDAVRWMEKSMGQEWCTVKTVKGGDHALMYNTNVVVEVLEIISGYWQLSD